MAESVFFKPVCIAFAIVALVESLIWTVLSFLAVLCYLDVNFLRHDSSKDYGLNNFTENLYNLYLSDEPLYKEHRLVTPGVFYPLMWIYFLLSLFLCFTSGVQIAVLVQISNIRKINLSTVIFQILTYTVCVFDIITCILFGVDYHLFIQATRKTDSALIEVQSAVILTLVVLSAKGFVLWIFNFVLSILVTILFRSKVNTNNEPILRTGPEAYARNYNAYNAYGDNIDENDLKGDHTLNSLKKVRPEEETEPEPPLNNSAWFTKSSLEDPHASDTYSAYLDPLDEVLNANSTWSRMPRANSLREPRSWTASRASSFRQPRSLVASLSPSPVPPPSRDMTTFGGYNSPPDVWDRSEDRSNDYQTGSSENWTNDDSDNEYDEIDNVSESMSKMSKVYPKTGRFTLEEPEPDYDK